MAWPSTAASTRSCGPLHDRSDSLSSHLKRLRKTDVVSNSVKAVGGAVIVIFLLAIFEVFSFAVFSAASDNVKFRSRVLYPADLSDADLQRYIENRDGTLGWPSKSNPRHDQNSHRERISPANDAIGNPKYCFEVYGDSFTFADDVDDAAAWPNRLAETTGCKVLNFGVGGFGVDQAVIRHERNARLADYAALLIYPDDIRRNLNRFRTLLSPSEKRLNFKPRFILSEDGGLTLVEIFSGAPEDYKQIVHHPTGLPEERFLPDSDGIWSKITLTFPYSLSVLRLARKIYREIDFEKLWTGKFKHGINGMNFPSYYFRDPGLTTEARSILDKLAERFQANCKAKRQTCFVILHPDIDYLEGDFRAERVMAYYLQNLKDQPNFLNMVDFLRAEMKGELCRYYALSNCMGHFNAAGNALVSKFFLHSFPPAFDHR